MKKLISIISTPLMIIPFAILFFYRNLFFDILSKITFSFKRKYKKSSRVDLGIILMFGFMILGMVFFEIWKNSYTDAIVLFIVTGGSIGAFVAATGAMEEWEANK
jgi:flagellar motor component MotA